MRCAKCGAENTDARKFCGDCGKEFVAREDVPVPDQPGVYYCHRHKKETTRITCGRCEKPVCTRCAVHGPAGIRCSECARNRVPIRPMGVLHSAGQTIQRDGPRTVWYLALWAMIVSFFSGFFGGDGEA